MLNVIHYGKQHITDEDINAVVSALKSDFLTQGPIVAEFEKKFASYVGSEFALAVSNGTAALHLSALALGIKEGDKVITTPITFAASSNCVKYCGGDVVFSDIDESTFLLDIKKVKKLLKSSPKGTYKGVIPVDFAGMPVNIEELRILADEYDLWILEDACHAPGAWFIDSNREMQKSGNGVFADLAVFSFHPVKHITTGEGGMITTNNKVLYEKLLLLRTHGITRNITRFTNPTQFAIGKGGGLYPGWYMEMQELGFNYRLTDIQAALGISQLSRADANLHKRKAIALRYDIAFKEHSHVRSQQIELKNDPTFSHAHHLYIIICNDRIGLYDYLNEKNITCQVHYIPTHLMPYYREFGCREGDCPFAEKYYKECLSLPMYPTLSIEEQNYIILQINNFFEK